ncbi:MAG: hypothetical protein AAFV19_06405 [Pseudomonadota bacterium]
MAGRGRLEEALARMPHRGAMRLIEAIEAVDEHSILCRARPHGGSEYPLRLDGHLEPAALTELGAQAAAAHASLFGMGAAHTGLVLSMNGIDIRRNTVPEGGNLAVRAERISSLDAAASYHFVVKTPSADMDEDTILSGEVLLSMVKAAT